MSTTNFRVPSLIVTGAGSIERAPEVLDRLDLDKVVIVTDRNLKSVIAPVFQALRDTGHTSAVYDGVVTEPSTAHVDEILAVLESSGADGLVAVGGG